MVFSNIQHSTFERLPVELILDILGSVADIRSLTALTCTCTTISKIFTDAQVQVFSLVLFREMDIELLPEATAVLQSSKSIWTKPAVLDFLIEVLDDRKISTQRWTLADAITVTRLYYRVTQLATDYASRSSRHIDSTIQKSELNRFQCAFYRFEMYCNLFGDLEHPVLSVEEQRNAFFSKFSRWENEQLACVHGFLYGLLMPDFNAIAEHDIVWGKMSIDYAEPSEPDYYLEPILARGINKVCTIVEAKGFEEKRKLFYPDFPRGWGRFLSNALEAANAPNDQRYLEEYTDDEVASISKSYFQDPDSGPFDTWHWAHLWTTRDNFVNSEPRMSLRECGYVMWDRSTLEKTGLLEEDWEEPDAVMRTDDEARRYEQREASLKRRTEIYWKGGRGWWSFDDESKVVWEISETSHEKIVKKEKEHREFESLGEAKKFLSGL